jgi:serine/threonine-protein kinase
MEYIEGEALTDLIKREGPVDLQRAGAILKQTADALQAAHELGIVHRDLKPDNIMIAKVRDGSDLVKVVDFGIAKAMSGEEGQDVTRTGLVVGTPEYMSPEQLSGDKLDGRSDVYSLSLVFFRMITGTLPFQADSAQEAMIKRLTDDPARLNDSLDGAAFPSELQTVMDHAMERMPSDRYATADEFAADVLKATAGAPAPTAPPPVDAQGATQLMDTGPSDPAVTEQLQKTRQSEAEATVAMSDLDEDATAEAEVAPPATAVTDAAAVQQHTPETPIPQTMPEEPKKKPYVAIAASVVVVGIVGSVGYVTLTGGDAGEPNTGPDSAVVAELVPGDADSVVNGGETQSGASEDQSATTTQQGNDQQDSVESTTIDPVDDPVEPPVTTVDSAAIHQELDDIFEGIVEASQRPALTERAQAIYSNSDMPRYLRGQAAYMVALGYIEDGDSDSTCRWIGNAMDMDPDNSIYQRARATAGCNL